MLLQELTKKCGNRHHAESLIKSRVHFSMSNGIENYSVVAPSREIKEGQLSYIDDSMKTYFSKEEAIYFCEKIKQQGVSILAIDHVIGMPNNISSIFIKQEIDKNDKNISDINKFIEHVEEINAGLWGQFVRNTVDSNIPESYTIIVLYIIKIRIGRALIRKRNITELVSILASWE